MNIKGYGILVLVAIMLVLSSSVGTAAVQKPLPPQSESHCPDCAKQNAQYCIKVKIDCEGLPWWEKYLFCIPEKWWEGETKIYCWGMEA